MKSQRRVVVFVSVLGAVAYIRDALDTIQRDASKAALPSVLGACLADEDDARDAS